MPAKSIAQQHLMQAAEHGATFPMAQKVQQSMTQGQMHDFSVGSEAGKPMHVPPTAPAVEPAPPMPGPAQPTKSLLQGFEPSIVGSNTSNLRQSGMSEIDATRKALAIAGKQPKKPSSRHTNLGKYLHPRKDGKTHGS